MSDITLDDCDKTVEIGVIGIEMNCTVGEQPALVYMMIACRDRLRALGEDVDEIIERVGQ